MGESTDDQGQDTNEFMTGSELDIIDSLADQLKEEKDRGDEDTTDSLTAMNLQQIENLASDNTVDVGAGDIFGLKDSIEKQLALGGTPVFNKDGTIGGVMGSMKNAPAFGMFPSFLQNMLPDTQVYTGIADLDPNRFTPDDDNTSNETTPPVMNQMTGKSQCPEGYVFDTQLQACRLKTRSDDQLGIPKDPPDGGQMFARNYSLLNQTPMNVPQGLDYNAMNTNFMTRFGTRPSIFKRPPNLLGFTPFGG